MCQQVHKLCAKYVGRTLLAGVNQIICVNWPHIALLWRVRATHSVKQSRIKDKSLLVFTILSLTTLPAICEVLQTHLLHPGLVMAFLNVHVGLQLSQGEGAVIDLSFQDHQPDAQHLVFQSHNYGYCKAFKMINLAGSVTGGVIKPLCVDFNVHNVVLSSTPNCVNLELCCRTWTSAAWGWSIFVSEVI